MKWLCFTLLLVGCSGSRSMHAHIGVTVSGQIAPELECNKIADAEARKVCVTAVEDQRRIDHDERKMQR